MLLVDSRVGSKELLAPLLHAGLPAESVPLSYGDVAFTGRGPGGAPLDIGIEKKSIAEVSSRHELGRLIGHQVPGLLAAYAHVWVIIEGEWRQNTQGQLTGWRKGRHAPLKGAMSAYEMEKRLLSLEMGFTGALHIRWVNTRRDTIRVIGALYRWWTDQDQDAHRSHLTAHTPVTALPVSVMRQQLQALPGVGPHAAQALEQHFGGSIRRALAASPDEWAHVTTERNGRTRKLGLALAEQALGAVK